MNRGMPYVICDTDGRPVDPRRSQGDHRRALDRPRRGPSPPAQQEDGEGPPSHPNRAACTGRPSPTQHRRPAPTTWSTAAPNEGPLDSRSSIGNQGDGSGMVAPSTSDEGENVTGNVCEHLTALERPADPVAEGCVECLAMGDTWFHLRVCAGVRPRRLLQRLQEQACRQALCRHDAPDHAQLRTGRRLVVLLPRRPGVPPRGLRAAARLRPQDRSHVRVNTASSPPPASCGGVESTRRSPSSSKRRTSSVPIQLGKVHASMWCTTRPAEASIS
jgi:hypothetical protein